MLTIAAYYRNAQILMNSRKQEVQPCDSDYWEVGILDGKMLRPPEPNPTTAVQLTLPLPMLFPSHFGSWRFIVLM